MEKSKIIAEYNELIEFVDDEIVIEEVSQELTNKGIILDNLSDDDFKDLFYLQLEKKKEELESFYKRMERERIFSITNEILAKKDYVLVDGSISRWNGSQDVYTVIKEKTIEEFTDAYIDLDYLELVIYSDDTIVYKNIHHDGINYYELTPFSFSDLTKKRMLEIIKSSEDLLEFIDEKYEEKLYQLNKDDLAGALEEAFEDDYKIKI